MSRQDSIKRFYIMPEVWVTVTQSQVFNWIKLVNERGISTDCISITTQRHDAADVKRIEKSIKGKFIEVTNHKRLIVNDLFLILILLKNYFKNIRKHDRIIFQTRLSSIGFTIALLRWLPKTEFIFESRAAANEEDIHTSKGRKVTLKSKIKSSFAKNSEKLMITKSHKVFCVSNALKDYYLKKYDLSGSKFFVFPGAADAELFFYKEDLRNEVRKELNLDPSDILIVYSGRLEMKWEIPDKIFAFFQDLHRKNNHFKLLLITPDVDLANEFIDANSLKNVTFVKQVALKDVNKYLNAADVGLLLREDIPMNNVASPTKFAEYLMTGIPVIISYGVYDFADNINETRFGVVVKGLDAIAEDEFNELEKSLTMDRSKIASWGLEHLSKESFIKKYINVLRNI